MSDAKKVVEIVDQATDIIFLGLMIIQQISNKTQDEVLEAIKTEGRKTDALLEQLK